MQETWWEHHIVSVIPELNAILRVECDCLTGVGHTAAGENASGGEAVDPEATVVDWAIAISEEARANRPHDSPDAERVHPHPVDNTECTVECMRAIFSLAHLNGLEESADSSRSLCHNVVDEVLEAASVREQPSLESLRHFIFFN